MSSFQPSRRAYAITIFLILTLCYGYFMPKWADWGANSRADLVYAFGDKGVLYIDDYHENTGDKACFAGRDYTGDDPCTDGHYYTDKSIGPSLLALPFYIVFKGVAALPPIERFISSGAGGLGNFAGTLNPDGQGVRPEAMYQGMALTFMTFFASAVPSALMGTVLFLFAARFTKNDLHAVLVALSYGLATIAFPYSNALYQHQIAAFGAFVGFFLLWRVIYENASLHWLWIVGLLFGLATITEYPVVPALGIIFIWAAIKMPNRIALYRVVLGAIPLGLLFAAYNYAVFQTPLPVGYTYSTNWQSEHQTGFLSLTVPTIERLYGLTFSPIRGIFLLSPMLLLAFPGLYRMWQQHKDQRGTVVAISLVVASTFLYSAASVMWWGGHTVGPRYIIPMLPFLSLPIVFAFDALFTRVWGQILAGFLIGVSLLHVWGLSIAGQAWPEMVYSPMTFEQMNASLPLLDHALPLLAQGNIARNYGGIVLNLDGFAGLIPLILGVIAIWLIVPRLFTRRPHTTSTTQPLEPGRA
jgi:4-amino-4-deoxy-L-arabinose transferase-like glycosyltransferase